MTFFFFILTYIILVLSIIGYGIFFSINFTSYNKITKNKISTGYIGIYGIFFLILISYVTNIFLPHDIVHNSVIFLIGIIFLIYYLFVLKIKIFKDKKYFLLSLLLSLFAILYFKNHDDFSYYHLSFIQNINLNKIEFGLGNFGLPFNHVSSLFFFHSLFKLPFTNDYFYFIGPASIMVFANSILIYNIFDLNKNKNLNLKTFLSILILLFINIFFYRLSEHGTDRSAQILILLIFLILFEILEKNVLFKDKFENFIIILTLIISIKSFYIIYISLFLIIFFKFLRFNEIPIFFRNYKIIFFSFFFGFLILLYNIAYTGCFIFPIKETCFDAFYWGIGDTEIIYAMNWYELWSKAGATPTYAVSNPEEYITGLNWVKTWIDNYFFNKMSDTLGGLILIVIIFIFFFKPKKFIFKYKKDFNIIFLILLIFTIEWFYNHPALRYGGYCLFALIFFIPTSIYLTNQNYNYQKNIKKIKILFFIGIFIFVSRNINRVINETTIYKYKPFVSPYYRINPEFYRLPKIKNKIFLETNNCKNLNKNQNETNCKIINSFTFFY